MIPIQILRVLSTIRQFDVPALLMGGQACVLYGAAEYSRDLDLAVLASDDALPRLAAAMQSLGAAVIAVPPFAADFLRRGHAVHFSVPGDATAAPLRVDVMATMRGVAPFAELWDRRTSVALTGETTEEVAVDVMALPDLVSAKKTQRDKDWPMLRRLVDASYDAGRDSGAAREQIAFWLGELRSPPFLAEAVSRFPVEAAASTRPAVQAVLTNGDVEHALSAEQSEAMAADRAYWAPLRRELEALRHAARHR